MIAGVGAPPLVSVIVPVHNGERFLAETLASALGQTYHPLEVIAVNNGSTDRSAAIIAEFSAVRCLTLPQGGVAAARNAGIASGADFLAFLDQDDLWAPRKIEAQMQMLGNDPALDYVITLQDRFLESGVEPPAWVRPGSLDAPVLGLDPSALLARRSAFEKVGGFDSRFVQASDSDWFFRARDAGLRLGVLDQVLTRRRVHADNNSRFVSAGRRDLRRAAAESIRRKRNAAVSVDGIDAIASSVPGGSVTASAQPVGAARSRPMRMLVIDARVVTPNRDGGSLRMFSLLRLLEQRGLDVSFTPSFPQSFPPFSDSLADDTARLQAIGIDLPANGTRTVEQHLQDAGHGYDIVLISGAFVAARHLAAVRQFAPRATLLYDTIDLHYLREYRAARLTGSVPRLQSALKVKRVELRTARVADVTLVVSEREQDVLRKEDPRIRTWVIPNVHPVTRTGAGPGGRRDLMFLGAFTFDANVDAVTDFVHQTLPHIQQHLPGLRLHIVGSDPTPEILALAGDDVLVTGYVEDLAGYFDRCRVFVAPLRFGAGIKGKLLLSMAHGLPAVASPVAAEGIPAADGRDILVARTPAEWTRAIARLHDDDALWTSVSERGRAMVGAHYSFEAVGRRIDGLLDLIARDRPVHAESTA